MRYGILAFTSLSALGGCGDPPCAPNERKVGTTCLVLEREKVPSDSADGTPPEAAGSSHVSDAGSSNPDAGPSTSIDASTDAQAATRRGAVYICPVPMQCAEWPMPDEQGKVKPSYSVSNDTVTDNVTKLIWQRRPSPPGCRVDGGVCTLAEASIHCANLTFAGRADWRLPSAVELQSIFSLYNVTNSVLADPFHDQSDTTLAAQVWTSDRTDTHEGSLVRMRDGLTLEQQEGLGEARCVSGGDHRTDSRYVITDDNEVLDKWTTLVWRRYQESGLFSFEEAKVRCAELGNGWRVPTAKELMTLVTPQVEQVCIDKSVFPPPVYASLWSDTAQQVKGDDGSIFVYHLMMKMDVNDELRCGQLVQEIPSRSPRVSVRCVR